MIRLATLAAGTALGTLLALAAAPGTALAGPCTDQINEVAKSLVNDSSMGAPTTGTLTGTAPGAIKPATPSAGAAESKETPPAPSLAEGGKTGGEAGMKEMNAASSQVATSPQDVRLQQQGQPTTAQGGTPDAAADKMSMAKTELDRARMLDAQGSNDCAGALDKARQMISG